MDGEARGEESIVLIIEIEGVRESHAYGLKEGEGSKGRQREREKRQSEGRVVRSCGYVSRMNDCLGKLRTQTNL